MTKIETEMEKCEVKRQEWYPTSVFSSLEEDPFTVVSGADSHSLRWGESVWGWPCSWHSLQGFWQASGGDTAVIVAHRKGQKALWFWQAASTCIRQIKWGKIFAWPNDKELGTNYIYSVKGPFAFLISSGQGCWKWLSFPKFLSPHNPPGFKMSIWVLNFSQFTEFMLEGHGMNIIKIYFKNMLISNKIYLECLFLYKWLRLTMAQQ